MLTLRHITKAYEGNLAAPVEAVSDVSLEVAMGELVAIMGPSGCGKSTLLTIAGGLQAPDRGTVQVASSELGDLSERDLFAHRRRHIGFVFQDLNLVSMLSAVENVALPLELDGYASSTARQQALKALGRVGMSAVADRYPATLSGGQQQRVAIARAVCGEGQRLILADEPTGSLDTNSAMQVLDVVSRLTGEGCSGVVVTHDPVVAERAHRIVHMQDGRFVSDEAVERRAVPC